MNNIIEIKNLIKYFGDVHAVDDISFSVQEGELFAFLGLNGAGKSTTINVLVGVEKRDSGDCLVNGISIDNISKILPTIGIVFQSSMLDNKLTVYDNIRYRAMLYGLNKDEFKENLNFLIEKMDLKDILKKQLGKLSGGQKRKVDIVRALIHNPKILILDEPTTGLDPRTRKTVWNLINELRSTKGLTVLLTTHYMEEASIADNVVIIDSGKIVAEGSPITLKNKFANDYLKIYKYDKSLEEIVKNIDIPFKINKEYLEIRDKCYEYINNSNNYNSFIELSQKAWVVSVDVNNLNKEKLTEKPLDERGIHTWIYSPSKNPEYLDDFIKDAIIAVDVKEIDNPSQYQTREEIRLALQYYYQDSSSHKNDALCLWQFIHDMKIGDVVFVKKGRYEIVARGIITSNYIYDDNKKEYKNIRNVKWTNKGSWQHPGLAVTKTLTDITNYREYVEKLNNLFENEAKDLEYAPINHLLLKDLLIL